MDFSDPAVLLAIGFLAAIGLPLVYLGGRYYVRRAQAVIGGERHVDASRFGVPDALIAIVLAFWFGLLAVQVIMATLGKAPAAEEAGGISVDGLLQTFMLHALIVGGILWSLHARGISAVEVFGLRKLSWKKVLKVGAIAYLAAWPLTKVAIIITAAVLQDKAEQQSVVSFFFNAVSENRWLEIGLTIFTAAVVAPIAEEFVFRGFIYGTLKRYGGPLIALIVTSLLFAAIHFNGLSFPALVVLAVCFTLLYELTGCLWVPMVMHCLFNSFSLLEMVILSPFAS